MDSKKFVIVGFNDLIFQTNLRLVEKKIVGRNWRHARARVSSKLLVFNNERR